LNTKRKSILTDIDRLVTETEKLTKRETTSRSSALTSIQSKIRQEMGGMTRDDGDRLDNVLSILQSLAAIYGTGSKQYRTPRSDGW
jgi:hypothetical protein